MKFMKMSVFVAAAKHAGFLYFDLSGFSFHQKSAVSRCFAIGRRCKTMSKNSPALNLGLRSSSKSSKPLKQIDFPVLYD